MISMEQAYDARKYPGLIIWKAAKQATDAGFRFMIFNDRIYNVASGAQLTARDEVLCIDSGKTVTDFEEATPCDS